MLKRNRTRYSWCKIHNYDALTIVRISMRQKYSWPWHAKGSHNHDALKLVTIITRWIWSWRRRVKGSHTRNAVCRCINDAEVLSRSGILKLLAELPQKITTPKLVRKCRNQRSMAFYSLITCQHSTDTQQMKSMCHKFSFRSKLPMSERSPINSDDWWIRHGQ